MASTQALLADYVRNRSDRAFQQLVNSYLGFVYSTALRILQGNRQLAEDVSQTVFVDLALKASGLPSDVSLGGWLHRHTCFPGSQSFPPGTPAQGP
jgi:DNA-directed RNA polymerase specialized sigma24 family protein